MSRESSSGRSSRPADSTTRRFYLPRARVLVALAVVALLGWGFQALWQQVAPQVIQQEKHLLSAQRISVSQTPEWITTDFVGEVVRDAGLDGRLSLLDDSFPQVIEDAFSLHPWVETVERIEKRYPQGVHVQLNYRRPVAVVEMSAKEGVLFVPVDSHAVHLPTRGFPDMRKRHLPRIGGIVDRPPVGQKWPDPRVEGAVEIADQLQKVWQELHLVDILPSARPEIREDHRYFVFDLITRGGTRIVWGAAPNAAPSGEHSFEAKLARLKKCVGQHGPLDSVHGPAVVDVRRELAITPRTVKKPPSADEDASVVK